MTCNSSFITQKIELNKKRVELEAAHAFAKAEAEAKQTRAFEIAKAKAEAKKKCTLEIAKVEEQLKIATAKVDAEERLIALFERASSVAVSSKAGPLFPRLTYWEGAQTFVRRFAQTQNRT